MRWLSGLAADIAEMHREQWEYRELLLQLIARDLRVRYKQTVMGFGWAVFMPVVNTVLFSVIFTRVAAIDTGTVPYPLFAYTGLLAWNYFATALRFATTSLSHNAVLVGKVYFPREVLPTSSVIVSAVDTMVASVVLVAMLAYYGKGVGAAVLALPFVFGLQTVLTIGIGLVLAMANLYFRDVKYLFEVAITVAMFGTAVLYPVEGIAGPMGGLLSWNPMTQIIEAYRQILFEDRWPFSGAFAATAAGTATFFALAWWRFHRAEFSFAERL